MERPVPDGEVVLVRCLGEYGAFVLHGQSGIRNTFAYRWYIGVNPEGAFAPDYTSSGTARGPGIEFGPFTVNWSSDKEGYGKLYYMLSPDNSVTSRSIEIALTGVKTIDHVIVMDKKWTFKAKPFQKLAETK
jgi:hypothetical protein